MQNIYLLIILIGINIFSIAQTYLQEDFSSGEMPPPGWTISAMEEQWSINEGNSAGGTEPEAMFSYINTSGTSYLMSPEIDLTGLTSISLQFKHYYDDYPIVGDPYIGVCTSSGGSWTSIWYLKPESNVGPEVVTLEFVGGDVGASNFQFCFYVTGYLYNFNYWHIDDVWLNYPLSLDAALIDISTPTYLNEPSVVSGTVKNVGFDISEIEINWSVEGGEIHSSTFSGLNLAYGETYEFNCLDLVDFPIGEFDLNVWVETVNGSVDENPDNDQFNKTINFVSYTTNHRPCFEGFTSSTSDPCASFNTYFDPWSDDHENEITLVKYPIGTTLDGDPYFTFEVLIRRSYYWVTGIPKIYIDGINTNIAINDIHDMFNDAMDTLGIMKIIGSHSFIGTTIVTNLSILPFANVKDAIVHIVVFENVTTGNIGGNGETQFKHVMMKMIPDANGTSVFLEDLVPFTFSDTVQLGGTNVEDWNDLGVALFVQDTNSKYIYQSNYSIEDGAFQEDATLASILIDDEPIPNFDPDVFEYTYYIEGGLTELPLVAAESNDLNATAIVLPSNDSISDFVGSTTIEVFAENLSSSNSYKIYFDYGTGEIEKNYVDVLMYPNPTSRSLFITGAENANILVYSSSGVLVQSLDNFSQQSIDLSSLRNGIYFIHVVLENNTISKKIYVVR